MKRDVFEYVGALHVHTTYSDGTYSIAQVARAAAEAGLDFVLIADHMTLAGLPEEGWYGSTLILVGYEINDLDRENHYLAFHLKEVFPPDLSPSQYVMRVREAGGFGFISHPDEKRTSHSEYPAYPWTNWDIQGFDGMEIWNYMSEWMESLNRWNVGFRMLFPDRAITGPTEKTLRYWDQSGSSRRVVAIGGVDAHAMAKKRGPFRFVVFSYERMFKTLMTHIVVAKPLTGDTGRDRETVYGALLNGSCFICNHVLGDGRGFRFFAETEADVYAMGDSLPFSKPTRLSALLPGRGLITLVRNGEAILCEKGSSLVYDLVAPGFYRVEVKRGRRFWILSNPIYVERF